MRMPDRIGLEPLDYPWARRDDPRILAALSRTSSMSVEDICRALWPDRGVDGYTWATTLGRLGSLARRGLVLRTAPKQWRRTWWA